jgi:hypothetical protein
LEEKERISKEFRDGFDADSFLYRAYYCTAEADEARKKVLLLFVEHAKIYIYRRLLWKKKK